MLEVDLDDLQKGRPPPFIREFWNFREAVYSGVTVELRKDRQQSL